MQPCSKFWLSILNWGCKEHPCLLCPDLGLLWGLEVPDWGLASLFSFGCGHWSLIHPCFEFWLSILTLNVQRTSMSFKSWFGALMGAGDSWLGFCILILVWIWSLIHPNSKIWLSIWTFKVQRTSMSFMSLFGSLVRTKGCWLGFGILILIRI